jgi:hypothetical protein
MTWLAFVFDVYNCLYQEVFYISYRLYSNNILLACLYIYIFLCCNSFEIIISKAVSGLHKYVNFVEILKMIYSLRQ